MYYQDLTLKLLAALLYVTVCPIFEMGALSWFSVETVERMPTGIFGRLVHPWVLFVILQLLTLASSWFRNSWTALLVIWVMSRAENWDSPESVS